MAPARLEPRHRGRIGGRLVREGRTGRGGGQAPDVDVVLDGDRDAVKRTLGVAFRHQRPGLGHRPRPRSQRDEHGRIAVGGDARIGALDRLDRRQDIGAMRPHDVGDGLGQAPLLAGRRRNELRSFISPLTIRPPGRGIGAIVPNSNRARSQNIVSEQLFGRRAGAQNHPNPPSLRTGDHAPSGTR